MKSVSLSLLLLPLACFAQIKQKGHGTYVIAAVCKNGILIGADTRCSYKLYEVNHLIPDEHLAYFDTIQKIFPLKRFVIANEGDVTFDTLMFYHFIKEFDTSILR